MFIITVGPDQADPKFNKSHITCRDCVQLLLYVDVIDAIIDTQILKNPNILLFRLVALDNEKNPDIGTIKKEGGGTFS